MASNTRERIITALSKGPLSFFELALKVYPPDDHPKAWNYSNHGGPPGCYMSLSAMIRRMGLVEWNVAGGPSERMVMLSDDIKKTLKEGDKND
jgi:hypothetical protein